MYDPYLVLCLLEEVACRSIENKEYSDCFNSIELLHCSHLNRLAVLCKTQINSTRRRLLLPLVIVKYVFTSHLPH